MRPSPSGLALVALLVLVAPPLVQAAAHTVYAYNFYWTPSSLTIAVGDTVTFASYAGTHTWVRDDGLDQCSTLPCTRTFGAAGTIPYYCGVHPSMVGTVFVGTPPSVTIDTPASGATVSGSVPVSGTASHATDGITGIELLLDGTPYATGTLASPGETSTSWTATLPTANVANGPHTLTARATASTGMKGSASIPIEIANPATFEIKLYSLYTASSATGQPRLSYTIQSLGNSPTGAFDVLAEYRTQGTWRTFASFEHASMRAFSSSSEQLTWDALPLMHVGRYPVRLTLDAGNDVAETNEGNNQGTATVFWTTSAVEGRDTLG